MISAILAEVRASRHRDRLRKLYRKYQDRTMVPEEWYICNLMLAESLATKKTAHGAIVECGTWRGGMAAGIMEVVGTDADYHFFDSFEGLPDAEPIDGDRALAWQSDTDGEKYHDNCAASKTDFIDTMEMAGARPGSYSIYQGWFDDTVTRASTGPIALLRLDGDWYKSTKICLDNLFDKVIAGGVVIIDDYGTWDGCTLAVHDFLAEHRRPEPVRRYGKSFVPYIIKGTD